MVFPSRCIGRAAGIGGQGLREGDSLLRIPSSTPAGAIFVGLEHGRRAWPQGAVGKGFEPTEAQPLLAEAEPQTGLDERLQGLDGEVFEHAQAQFASFV